MENCPPEQYDVAHTGLVTKTGCLSYKIVTTARAAVTNGRTRAGQNRLLQAGGS